jgi:hypothetical protein
MSIGNIDLARTSGVSPPEKKPFLVERFPLMFDEDEESPHEWFPLPADFPRFLKSIFPRSSQRRDLVLELFQRLDFNGKSTVIRLSDETATKRTGIDRRDIQAQRKSADFNRWVRVVPGEQRKKGYEPTATVYDLHKLMLCYNSWHYKAAA